MNVDEMLCPINSRRKIAVFDDLSDFFGSTVLSIKYLLQLLLIPPVKKNT